MPISNAFRKRLFAVLPKIILNFGTPFILYDIEGIKETYKALAACFEELQYNNFFAVKATPEPYILEIMRDLGCGFDCSSIPELLMVRKIGAKPEDIMFTSNNTSEQEFEVAAADGGCILNLDDISLIDQVPKMPERICFRYNPGPARSGNVIIGDPVESKYGVPDEDIIEAYARAKERGAAIFGLHAMICSNELNYEYLAENANMLINVARRLYDELGIELEFINIGGGIGIPYKPEDEPVDIIRMGSRITEIMKHFENDIGYMPKLYTESGRYITGPHGVLVMSVQNIMNKYRKYIGTDACMNANMRPAMYGAHHEISALGKQTTTSKEVVDVVGSLCENNDKFAIQRVLPKLKIGDILIQDDVGAHSVAMGFNYNGRLRPKQLALEYSTVHCIRRKQVPEDLDITLQGGDVGKTIQLHQELKGVSHEQTKQIT